MVAYDCDAGDVDQRQRRVSHISGSNCDAEISLFPAAAASGQLMLDAPAGSFQAR